MRGPLIPNRRCDWSSRLACAAACQESKSQPRAPMIDARRPPARRCERQKLYCALNSRIRGATIVSALPKLAARLLGQRQHGVDVERVEDVHPQTQALPVPQRQRLLAAEVEEVDAREAPGADRFHAQGQGLPNRGRRSRTTPSAPTGCRSGARNSPDTMPERQQIGAGRPAQPLPRVVVREDFRVGILRS